MGLVSNLSGIGDWTLTVTPSDNDDISPDEGRCVGLFVETGGALTVVYENDKEDTVTLLGGQVWPFQVKRVKSTGITASGIHAIMVRA